MSARWTSVLTLLALLLAAFFAGRWSVGDHQLHGTALPDGKRSIPDEESAEGRAGGSPSVRWDRELWHNAGAGGSPIDFARNRQRLARVLVDDDRLLGLSREMVLEILGEPHGEPWSPTYPVAGWSLGQGTGVSSDDTVPLLVEFDEHGLAMRAWIP